MTIQPDLFSPNAVHIQNVETEGVKYAGSKLKLIPHILSLVAGCGNVRSVLDGFSGTTRVSQAFAKSGYDTTANDISVWSETFARCYLERGKDDAFYQSVLDELNRLPGTHGWFTETYGTDGSKSPFQTKNLMRLDAIRSAIDEMGLDSVDKSVILTSLVLALDRVDSTLGHFASYLADWSPRSFGDLRLRLPKRFPVSTRNTVLRGDVFDAIGGRYFDLAYFDPPYGSNNEKMPPSRIRYAAYYHFWKTVVLNDRPAVFGKAKRREDSRDTANPSVFEEYRKDESGRFRAMVAIRDLLERTDAQFILLSYSSGGRATREELMDAISENGTLEKAVSVDYKRNVMANMRWTNEWTKDTDKNQEYLFLLRKRTTSGRIPARPLNLVPSVSSIGQSSSARESS